MMRCNCVTSGEPPVKKLKSTTTLGKYDLFANCAAGDESAKENAKPKGMAEMTRWEHFHGDGLASLHSVRCFLFVLLFVSED